MRATILAAVLTFGALSLVTPGSGVILGWPFGTSLGCELRSCRGGADTALP